MRLNRLRGYIMITIALVSLVFAYSLIEYWFNVPSWKAGVIVCLFIFWNGFWDSGMRSIKNG